jgi:hypothetical protein
LKIGVIQWDDFPRRCPAPSPQPISCAAPPGRPDTRRQASDLLLTLAAVESHASVSGPALVPPALLRDLVIITARLAGRAWLETNADSAAALTALQATWQPPPLPELDQILARVLSDRFRLPSPTAAASAQVDGGGLGRLEADPGVGGQRVVAAGDDRAQVQFGDLREIVSHAGYPEQHVLE